MGVLAVRFFFKQGGQGNLVAKRASEQAPKEHGGVKPTHWKEAPSSRKYSKDSVRKVFGASEDQGGGQLPWGRKATQSR